MRAVIQRVSSANVAIENVVHAEIATGLVIFLGVETNDHVQDVEWLAGKIAAIRVFSDDQGKMNLSMKDIEAQCLVVSQFTLHASTKKGNRPSFIRAARPDQAIPLYEQFIRLLGKFTQVKSGVFGANMQVGLTNDGPVTIVIDSKNKE